MKWITRPAANNPKGVILAYGSILLSMVCVGLLTGLWGAKEGEALTWAVIAGALLFISLRNFFMTTTVILDENGITLKEIFYTRKRPWAKCKSLHTDSHGVLVSPFSYTTRLENYRGIYLRFEGNKEQVMAFLEQKIKIEDPVESGENNGR